MHAANDPRVAWERRVAGLDLAPPDLLAHREMQVRAESKFVLADDMLSGFVDRLGRDYVVLAAGEQRVAAYCSLYFDTPDLSCFHAHRRGRRLRHKVRVRHYPDRELSVLEVKMRRSEHVTVKARLVRRFGDSVLGSDDLAFVRGHVMVPAPLVPQVWVTYRRLTLLGVRASERITVDVDVTVRRGTREARLLGAAIVEVKQPRLQLRSAAVVALRQSDARSGSVSKYCAALAVLCPDLRVNRMRPDLRALKEVGAWVS